MPAVNWVERGRFGEGNSVPRYYIVRGTARQLAAVPCVPESMLTGFDTHWLCKRVVEQERP